MRFVNMPAWSWSIEPDARWSTYENFDTASRTRTFLGLGGLTKSCRCTIRPCLEKFAFVLPEGEQAPPDETPAKAQAGEKFVTKQFGSEHAAISWLTADS